MNPEAAVHAVVTAAPPDTRIVDEGPTTDPLVRRFLPASMPDRFFYSRGGGLGWGMGAAMGISLAGGREPVLCVVGDGSALYSPQALWTAARWHLPVTFAVMNNGSYLVLKRFLKERDGASARSGQFVGVDLDRPDVDFVALAESFGVRARRPNTPREAAEAVAEGLASGEPSLLDVRIEAPLSEE
jgi:benzoylformate decarboxylase